MEAQDQNWEDMLQIAKIRQQELYEDLPGWTKYYENEYIFLKENIGYAIYGAPTEAGEETCSNFINYSPEQRSHIEKIFEILVKYKHKCETKRTHSQSVSQSDGCYILYDIIYVALFRVKLTSKEEIENLKKDEYAVNITPIFKVSGKTCTYRCPRNCCGNAWNSRCKEYIKFVDLKGRVYPDWQDFLENNKFPECTMVLPMDGLYQPDLNFFISENSSTVWLDVKNSPATNVVKKIVKGADIASTVASIATIGVSVASMLTPIGPTVAAGAAVAGVCSSVWSVGRSTQGLADRFLHDETISPTDTDAFGSWLSIAGAAVAGAASVTNKLIVDSVKRGATIGLVTQRAHDCLTIGNILVSGAGLGYHGTMMYRKYQETEQIDTIDIVLLTSSLLFFSNSVINAQSARSLIKSTQGGIIDDFKGSIKAKNFKKKFRKIIRRADQNNIDDISRNAEVIKYINNRVPTVSQPSSGLNISVHSETKTVMINDIKVFDPKAFVIACAKRLLAENSSSNGAASSHASSQTFNTTYNNQLIKLKDRLSKLITEFCKMHHFDPSNANFDADNILERMQPIPPFLSNGNLVELFQEVLHILSTIINRNNALEYFLLDLVHLLWSYVRSVWTLNQFNLRASALMNKILSTLYIASDTLIEEICAAFGGHLQKSSAARYTR